jgi:hypothetical protein
MAIRIDEQGREWQTITNEDGTEFEIEINKKPVIVTAEEAKKKIKEYEDKVKEAKLKVWNEYNIQEPIEVKPRFQPSPPVFTFG